MEKGMFLRTLSVYHFIKKKTHLQFVQSTRRRVTGYNSSGKVHCSSGQTEKQSEFRLRVKQ